MRKFMTLLFCLAFGLMACQTSNTNTTYNRSSIGHRGPTYIGKIIAMNDVNVEGTSGVGTVAGAVAGGAAGSMLGGNTAINVIGAVGGAVLGGVVGGATEKAISDGTAIEFLVELKYNGQVVAIVQSNELNLRVGDQVVVVEIDGENRIRQKIPN